jgi:hypothetical protein
MGSSVGKRGRLWAFDRTGTAGCGVGQLLWRRAPKSCAINTLLCQTTQDSYTRSAVTKPPFPHLAKGGKGAFAGDGTRQCTNVMWFDLGGMVCGMARNPMARSAGILRTIAEDLIPRSSKVVSAQT